MKFIYIIGSGKWSERDREVLSEERFHEIKQTLYKLTVQNLIHIPILDLPADMLEYSI